MGRRQVKFIEKFEEAPNADPVAVIAPGKRPSVRSNSRYRQQITLARTERKMFDVEAKIACQPLSVRPGVIRAVNNRRIRIAIMIWKLHIGIPAYRPVSAYLALEAAFRC
jgi:hypothetical protein